jgi:hypothetical protein
MMGLTRDQADAARVLAELGPQASLAALAAELDVSRCEARRLLLCLEERGWLAADRRTLIAVPPTPPEPPAVTITPAGWLAVLDSAAHLLAMGDADAQA